MLRLHWSLIALCIASFGEAQYTATVKTTTTSGASSWQTWRGERFTINLPADWTSESSATAGVPVTFLAPRDSASSYREQFDLRSENISDKTSQQIALIQEDRVKALNGKFKASNTSTVDDQGDIILEFTTGDEGAAVHHLQHVHVVDGRSWIMEYSAAEPDYADHLYLAETMMASFRMREPKKP